MLYSLLKSLLMPPGIIILMLLGAFVAARGVLPRLLVFVPLCLLTLMCLPVVGSGLMAPLEPYPALGRPGSPIPPDAQAIVILSAGRWTDAPEYDGDTLDDLSLHRLRYGVRLHRITGLPLYVTGGRLPSEPESLGQLMADVLREEYRIEDVVVEGASRTTWENAVQTAALLRQRDIRRILLVSDAWHLPRAVEAFERAGQQVTPAPTAFKHHSDGRDEGSVFDWLPSMSAFRTSYYAIHEHLGRAWYQIRASLDQSPVATGRAASSAQ